MKRRAFLSGMTVGITLSGYGWAATGETRFISAANDAQNRSFLVGMSQSGKEVFRHSIPSRGHAAAIHPKRAEAVAFARRPGNFAMIIECAGGHVIAQLNSQEGRHFYGHGAFSADGNYLLTTENDIDTGTGLIGVWDANQNYRRVDTMRSGGIGPHEIIRLPDGGFAVANGGIQTHPDFGRAKLNIPTMRPNLTYFDNAGRMQDVVEPPADMQKNSIRHIATDDRGRVAIALQWQGNPMENVPLLALHERGQELTYKIHPLQARLKHYAGSVARNDTRIVMTGPKGGYVFEFTTKGDPVGAGYDLPLASGVTALDKGFLITHKGGFSYLNNTGLRHVPTDPTLTWDNHVVHL